MPTDPQPIPAASGDLIALLYDDLHAIASDHLRRERADHTLQPTALVHEAYLKLADRTRWQSEAHFCAVASSAMRQILVDHARQHARRKRGGGRERLMLTTNVAGGHETDFDIIALNEAMERLATLDARKARVVEMRFFGGLTAAECGSALGIARKTAEADWYFARAWLLDTLGIDD